MVIGLLGFCFVNANMGCEALSYSFIQMLKECMPDEKLEICLFEEHEELGEFPSYFNDITFTACHVKLKDIHGRTFREMKRCDLIFDITYGDGFSDIYYSKYAIKTIAVKEFAHLSGKKFILLPQTYGPFSNPWIERAAMHVIKKADYVYSRDELSASYIQAQTGRHVPVYTDLALYLHYQPMDFDHQKLNVGINISGLLYRGGFHSENQFQLKVNYRDYIDGLLNELVKDRQIQVHIIPHVIESIPRSNDGDVEVCKQVKKKFPEVVLAPAYENPIKVKNYIAGMDIFSGARMHSTIAAFSSGTPTIPFAYSRKFKGLYENLDYPYYIEATQMDTKLAIDQTINYINERNLLKKQVDESLKIVRQQLLSFQEELKKVIYPINNMGRKKEDKNK